MNDESYKEWPCAITREPVTIIPTSQDPALAHGNMVFCVNLGKPKLEDIPHSLRNYFNQVPYPDLQKERGIPVMLIDEKPYIELLMHARHFLALEKNIKGRIHAITVAPVNALGELNHLLENKHFLRINGIHGIALMDRNELFKPIRVGIINNQKLGLAL